MSTLNQLYALSPELWILAMACVTLLAGLGKRPNTLLIYLLAQASLVGAFILTWHFTWQVSGTYLADTFVLDPLAGVLKLAIYAISSLAFAYAYDYIKVRQIPLLEFYVLGLLAVLGMQVTISGHNLITLYLGIELLSLPLYAMAALQRDAAHGPEAAMKYFIMGCLASGMLLYGFSLLYGATGSLDVGIIAEHLTANAQPIILLLSLVFIIAGLAFKFGMAPFHMWAPDVYQGAPNAMALFLAAAPKIAILGMTLRLLAGALPSLASHWQQLLMVAAVLSMLLGNIIAIAQSSLKRMLAYSSIAHMGYLALGLIAATPQGYGAAIFYAISYALMSAGAFGVLTLLSRTGIEVDDFTHLQGLNTRQPWLALMMLILMFSMAGIPPVVGFFAKLAVLQALVQAQQTGLAVIAILTSVIGAYYYLRVVKVMYFDAPLEAIPISNNGSIIQRVTLSINGIAILALGFFPNGLLSLCRTSVG